ncbi:hypothetical protein B0H16DRAFT_1522851 [Mycena metata]|uniref:Uncharacterized protein n=1 Tax=Mycena metata TaxID=1033252 RepID=A0AAD7NKW1_9AGAR|nr:hypothetical protein B0H16DRAFT_1522851 [Mycena metata]
MHPHPDKTDRPPHRARHWHCEGLGILSTTPRLTEIDLGYVEWLPDHLPRLFLPAWGPRLQQLTTFHGRNVWLGFANVIELLKTAAQLIHCDIRCNLDDLNPTEEEQTPTLLPNLLNLNVTFRTMFPRFWNFITAPKLRLLSISSVYDEDDRWGQQEFIAFRLRSKFTLIRLLLRFDFSDIADDIMDILNLCQGVRELTLRWTGPSYDPALHISRLVEELGAGSYDSLWLPNLSSLHIDLTQESLQALTSRVQTQARAAGGRADRFQVLFSTELEEAEYERLHGTEVRALRETGCRVGVEKMSFYGGEYYAVGGEEEGDGDGDEHEEEDEGEDMEVDEGEGEEMAVEGDEDEDENGEGEEMQVEQGEGEVIGTDIPQEEDLNWNEYVVNNDECWLVE